MAMLPQTESRRMPRDVRRLLAGSRLPRSGELQLRRGRLGSRLLRQCRADHPGQPDRQPDGRDALQPDRRPGRQPGRQPQPPGRARARVRNRPLLPRRCRRRRRCRASISPCASPGCAPATALPEQWGATARAGRFLRCQGRCRGAAGTGRLALREDRASGAASRPRRHGHARRRGRSASSANCIRAGYRSTNSVPRPSCSNSNWTALLARSLPAYREISRFPAVTRDLALVVGQEQPVQPLLDALHEQGGEPSFEASNCSMFTRAKGSPEGKKALHFV